MKKTTKKSVGVKNKASDQDSLTTLETELMRLIAPTMWWLHQITSLKEKARVSKVILCTRLEKRGQIGVLSNVLETVETAINAIKEVELDMRHKHKTTDKHYCENTKCPMTVSICS